MRTRMRRDRSSRMPAKSIAAAVLMVAPCALSRFNPSHVFSERVSATQVTPPKSGVGAPAANRPEWGLLAAAVLSCCVRSHGVPPCFLAGFPEWMNGISRKPARTVAELASARQHASTRKALGGGDELINTNPPTPCQISKRPPAPKPKGESAGHQGVAGGGKNGPMQI